MTTLPVLLWLFPLFVAQGDLQDSRVPLHLLNILPFPDSRLNSGWDRAYDLIPAAQLAVDQINHASHILPGYKLKLVNVDSEACGISSINKGLVNTYAGIFDPKRSLNVVGLTGLFCSCVTNAITSVFGHRALTYMQLAGSTTPMHRDTTKFPWLVHLVSSSTAFNDALLALISEFNWQRISIIHNALSVFHRANAADLDKRAKNANNILINANIPITGYTAMDRVYSILIGSGSRVVYISALNSESAHIMCEAYKRKALYPGHVYILPERSVRGLLSEADNTDCTSEQILEALEGAFFMRYKLANNNNTTLVSNLTYREYHQQYLERLRKVANSTTNSSSVYANVMHDQIWAFALALDSSLDTFAAANMSLDNLQGSQMKQFASAIRSKFKDISFEGASGLVKFNLNREESSAVEVLHVMNGKEELLGTYNPDANETLKLLRKTTQPPDSFETRTILLPVWESALFNVVIVLFIAMTTFVLIFVVVFKDRPEVKALSPPLSFAMIIGCYFLFVSALTKNIREGYLITDYHIFTLLCNLQAWLWMIGLTLIFSALLLRLLRIYYIFKAYGKVSSFWKDKYLIMCILTICSGGILILIIWTAVDRLVMSTTIEYHPNTAPPFYESKSVCSCETMGIWLSLILPYNGVLMIVIVLLAVKTRKIRLSNFKNTKQTNSFIVLTCMTLGFLVPLWYLIGAYKYNILGHFIACYIFSCAGVYCQLFMFLPRVFITMVNIRRDKFDSTMSRTITRETQFSHSHIP